MESFRCELLVSGRVLNTHLYKGFMDTAYIMESPHPASEQPKNKVLGRSSIACKWLIIMVIVSPLHGGCGTPSKWPIRFRKPSISYLGDALVA